MQEELSFQKREASLTQSEAGLLQSKRKAINAQGRSILLDSSDGLIYLSKQGDPLIGLNGAVFTNNGDRIVCRHLAFFASKLNIKNYESSLGSVPAIQAQPDLMENFYDNKMRAIFHADTRLFHTKFFGNELEELSQNLRVNEQSNWLLLSPRHVMAINIHCKEDSESSMPYYVVKFYDPNGTASHLRLLCDNLNALHHFGLKDLLYPYNQLSSEDIFDVYFLDLKVASLVSTDPKESKPSIALYGDEGNVACLKENLFFSLYLGWTDEVSDLTHQILSDNNLSYSDKLDLFLSFSESTENKAHPVLGPFYNNRMETVLTYYDIILSTDQLNLEDKFKLLVESSLLHKGLIFKMYQWNHNSKQTAMVVDMILHSDWPPSEKLSVLTKGTGCTIPHLIDFYLNGPRGGLIIDTVLLSDWSASEKLSVLTKGTGCTIPHLIDFYLNGPRGGLIIDTVLLSDWPASEKLSVLTKGTGCTIPHLIDFYLNGPRGGLIIDTVLLSDWPPSEKLSVLTKGTGCTIPHLIDFYLNGPRGGLIIDTVLLSDWPASEKLSVLTKGTDLSVPELTARYFDDKGSSDKALNRCGFFTHKTEPSFGDIENGTTEVNDVFQDEGDSQLNI